MPPSAAGRASGRMGSCELHQLLSAHDMGPRPNPRLRHRRSARPIAKLASSARVPAGCLSFVGAVCEPVDEAGDAAVSENVSLAFVTWYLLDGPDPIEMRGAADRGRVGTDVGEQLHKL